jgi:hypothetical protein
MTCWLDNRNTFTFGNMPKCVEISTILLFVPVLSFVLTFFGTNGKSAKDTSISNTNYGPNS